MDKQEIQEVFNKIEEAGLAGQNNITLNFKEMNLIYRVLLEILIND